MVLSCSAFLQLLCWKYISLKDVWFSRHDYFLLNRCLINILLCYLLCWLGSLFFFCLALLLFFSLLHLHFISMCMYWKHLYKRQTVFLFVFLKRQCFCHLLCLSNCHIHHHSKHLLKCYYYCSTANVFKGFPMAVWNLVLFWATCCVGTFLLKHLLFVLPEKDE